MPSPYDAAVRPADILVTDRVAVVTGGGAGIGQGIAVGLAAFGADVVIADVDADRAAVTAAKVRAEARGALPVPTDMSDAAAVDALVSTAVDHFGRVDILVNNAGGVRRARFLEQEERNWRRHIDLNLVSAIAASSAAARAMIAGGRGGSIINVASIEALRAAPMYAVYAACKAAMTSLTRTLAVELAEHDIRVNALAPDVIATAGIRGIVRGPVPEPLPPPPAAWTEGLRRYIPLGHEGDTEDMAAAAVFLASPMARYITGVTLSVDGGTWASSGWVRTDDLKEWELF